MIDYGAGVRAGQYLVRAGQAFAAMRGSFDVSIEDVKKGAIPVLRHRLSANFQAQADGLTSESIVERLVREVPEPEIPKRVPVPDFAHLLPEPIQRFTTGGVYDADDHQHLSFTQGGGHGGSHPHLVHEFVTALVEGRDPYPNARQSANWTCTGILAHESAMKGGAIMKLPEWSFSS
jgi:hypothetical protein